MPAPPRRHRPPRPAALTQLPPPRRGTARHGPRRAPAAEMSDGAVLISDSGSEGGRSPPPRPAVSLRPGRARPAPARSAAALPSPRASAARSAARPPRPVPRSRGARIPRQAAERRAGGLPGTRWPRFRGSWCPVTGGRGGQRPRGAPPERASGPGCARPSRGRAGKPD